MGFPLQVIHLNDSDNDADVMEVNDVSDHLDDADYLICPGPSEKRRKISGNAIVPSTSKDGVIFNHFFSPCLTLIYCAIQIQLSGFPQTMWRNMYWHT